MNIAIQSSVNLHFSINHTQTSSSVIHVLSVALHRCIFSTKTGNVSCVDEQVSYLCTQGPVPQFLLMSTRWCACLIPSTIFPFPLPESPTHTGPLSVGMISAKQTHSHINTHMHTHRATVTASLFSHWDTQSTFIALSQ